MISLPWTILGALCGVILIALIMPWVIPMFDRYLNWVERLTKKKEKLPRYSQP